MSNLEIGTQCQLRTGVWYGDQPLTLEFPKEWNVTILWPRTPTPLSDEQIAEVLEKPIGQPPIRQLCLGKRHPVVIVDDLNRPTPASRVMPFLLKHFQQAGLQAESVTIVMAPGTHGPPPKDAMLKKIGPEAASRCQLVVHNHTRDAVKIGRTSFGTPVLVNRDVLKGDFVLGIGGVYPNYTAGFGGGSKLALGVLGTRSIRRLHYGRHSSMGWGNHRAHNSFREDLDEIARMIGLKTTISLTIDPDRQVVGIQCGDYSLYFDDAVKLSRHIFKAPVPQDADVVIANTYPGDSSLLFAKMKGFAPLNRCAPCATRIAIASCPEGPGRHDLFPLNPPRLHRYRLTLYRISKLGFGQIIRKIAAGVARRWHGKFGRVASPGSQNQTRMPKSQNPIWLYRPGFQPNNLSCPVPGIRIHNSWGEIIRTVREEQGDRSLRVLFYPCAPLQCFDVDPT